MTRVGNNRTHPARSPEASQAARRLSSAYKLPRNVILLRKGVGYGVCILYGQGGKDELEIAKHLGLSEVLRQNLSL